MSATIPWRRGIVAGHTAMDPGSTEGLCEQGCVACPRALVYWFTCTWREGRAVGREVRLLIEEQLMVDARGRG